MKKTCTCCYKPKDIEKFGNHQGGKRNICKVCKCLENTNSQILRAAKKNPENYRVCNDCDRTFSIIRGRPRTKKYTYSDCKFCNSKDTEKFQETVL